MHAEAPTQPTNMWEETMNVCTVEGEITDTATWEPTHKKVLCLHPRSPVPVI